MSQQQALSHAGLGYNNPCGDVPSGNLSRYFRKSGCASLLRASRSARIPRSHRAWRNSRMVFSAFCCALLRMPISSAAACAASRRGQPRLLLQFGVGRRPRRPPRLRAVPDTRVCFSSTYTCMTLGGGSVAVTALAVHRHAHVVRASMHRQIDAAQDVGTAPSTTPARNRRALSPPGDPHDLLDVVLDRDQFAQLLDLLHDGGRVNHAAQDRLSPPKIIQVHTRRHSAR
jgi:hypothetical protein